jgi:predicted membrane protein (TIGR00267 family)
LLLLGHSHAIARRYFVVNGFDGALTMLGLLMGFYVSDAVDLNTAVTACLGAAIALGMSGFSSAYLSEAAERRQEFQRLQKAMISDLSGSAPHKASIRIPLLVAAVNGVSPFIISVIIIVPLWLAQWGIVMPMEPFEVSIGFAFVMIFLLGVFLSGVSGVFWLLSGLQALLIALVTAGIIYFIG